MNVAERIAAGEVIERPSSLVKELLENSIDAGATEILVQLEDGGKAMIEVLDNGHGMPPQDLELSIERHATSKLSSLEDLDRLITLGFRGEALASIAAVSELTITSRTQDADSAYELAVGDLAGRLLKQPQAQKITFGHFINTPHGTRIRAQGLFSQIPARLKFLKSQGTEVSQVREWMERLAMAHPHIGFQLFSEDRAILQLRASDEGTRVKAILADGEDYPLVTATNDQDGFRDLGLKVRVHWLQGMSLPQSKRLIQVVNGRAIRDKVLQQALLMPFRQALLPGQFPALALFIDVNPSAIDVNVHPTKSEIRFLDSRKVFQTIENLVKRMISKEGAPAFAAPQMRTNPFQSESGRTYSDSVADLPPVLRTAYDAPPSPSDPGYSNRFSPGFASGFSSAFAPQNDVPQNGSAPSWLAAENRSFSTPVPYTRTASFEFQPATHPETPASPLAWARYIGLIFQTYLLYEDRGEMVLIDQHAAHERIRYEKLRQRVLGKQNLASQSLLIPEVVKFQPESYSQINTRIHWLTTLGFETELFGEDSIIFRSVPAEWGTSQIKIRLKNLIERLVAASPDEDSGTASPESWIMDESLFESLAREACHSAVRAGDPLENCEAQELMKQLFLCKHPWNCPHGRPTVVRVPQGKLEEWFQRRV
jgi:DNA mismatch repair protein MutL